MPLSQTTSLRVESIRARLAQKREKAAFGYNSFAANYDFENDISLPSVSLRAMLERVKLTARETGTVASQCN